MAPAQPARRRRPGADDSERGTGQDGDHGAPRRTAHEPPARKAHSRAGVAGAAAAMRSAAEQLSELLGRAPDSVSSIRPTEDGWEAHVEVVELARIPDTTSVMASYRVAIDENGELVSYERTRRYSRGMIDRPA
ncbi:gas vesicle protein [Streptomyces roseus]|uniref:gas vesicle protein GvpO n=1 Tax=Streptomyces roseus TaxID=66430 RepID=UPI0033C03F5E